MNLENLHRVYFVGIGGIGMSALARYFNGRGAEVFGYDKTETTLTKTLVSEGMKIHYKEDLSEIPDHVDLVVYTPAIPDAHQELQYFRKEGYPVKKRAEVLGIISRNLKTIAVAGTHGKTTTSSIVAHVLRTGGIDCTAFLGGIAQNFKSNFVWGKDDWAVIEADEYDRSFLHLTPDIAIVLSMDADHLDIYGEHDVLKATFTEFVSQTKEGGKVLVKSGLSLQNESKDFATFGIESGNYSATNWKVKNGLSTFDVKSPNNNISDVQFTMAGKHNSENAMAAIAVAQLLGIEQNNIKKALASFKGIKRRFERIYENEQVVFIDDYAHHPTELTAAIDAARSLFPDRKITGIFQPHLYSRTQDFVDGFAAALDTLDQILLMDIYPARELPIEGVSSKIIFDKMKNPNCTLVTKATLMQELQNKDLDVVLTLGAGDIDTFVEPIKSMLDE